MRGCFKTHVGENFLNHLVPVMGGAPQTVQGLAQKPVFVITSFRIALWWLHDGEFVWRESGVAECIFAIALFKNSFVANGFGSEKTKGSVLEDRSVSFGLVEVPIFEVAENDNARFGTMRIKILIGLYDKDTHGGDGFRNFSGMLEGEILGFADCFIDVMHF